ncbi:MAG: WS/DGAT/MGAT family O-acyltransferase, partial [Anaeromyxobacteraceae bacterium]
MTWSERLGNLDAMFLDLEDRTSHMHVGAVMVYEGRAPSYAELLASIAARLDRVPRYRQRLAFVPFGTGRPVWVDAADLDLEYHVRHTALPPPGGEEPLRKLAGRLFAQRLDRGKPLWELWLIEGLGEGRFAVLSKTHHCMVDGLSGVDLATVLHDLEPDRAPPAPPPPWTPRPAPDRARLLASSLRDQLTRPLDLAREALSPSTEGRKVLGELVGGLKPLLGISQMGFAPPSSLNQPIGPHRRWEMTSFDLGAVKHVRAALGGTVNDVILAAVAGAVRTLLQARGETPRGDLRAFVPVSVRAPGARGTTGNQVAAVFCPLPVGEPDPVARLQQVSAAMKNLKETRQAVGALALTHLGEFTPPTIAAQAARLASSTRWFNLVVTNVPGPQVPMYLLGRKLVACYPVVPLAHLQTIGIALLSYCGAVDIGLLGDADRARDLPALARALRESMDELVACAAAAPASAPAVARG